MSEIRSLPAAAKVPKAAYARLIADVFRIVFTQHREGNVKENIDYQNS